MIDIDPISDRLVQSVTVILTSAQLLHLNTSPVTIVAAPGPGNAILVTAYLISYYFASSAYDYSGSGNDLLYGSAAGVSATGGTGDNEAVFNQTASNAFWASAGGFYNGSTSVPSVDVANQPLVFSNANGDMTAGNGTAKITVYYLTVPL